MVRRLLRLAFVVLAGSLAAATPPPCSRVVAVGDLHGGYDAFVSILRETGLVDEKTQWIGGEACLVQTGDLVDRGGRPREILELLMRLTAERPERVHALIGNHDVMNVVGDLRYAEGDEYEAFAAEETDEERERGYSEFVAARPDLPLDETERRAAFEAAYPPGYFAHRRAFSPEGRYGAWILSRPALLVLQGTLFVHGGISPADAALGVDEVNRLVRRDIRDYLETREALVREGWLGPLVPFGEDFAQVNRLLNAKLANGIPTASLEGAQHFVSLFDNHFSGEDSPLWNRDLALADEADFAPLLGAMVEDLGVERIVVGHTTQQDGRIGVRFGGKVLLIDTGAGPAYGGRPSALEIRDGVLRAVYPGESETLDLQPALSDPEIERFLLEATVVHMEEIPTGISKPQKVLLERGGRRRKAAFKTIDIQRSGVTRFERSKAEVNFTDSYVYDRAAYLFDRYLGLGMVPVVVLRRIGEADGALVDWVERAIDEQKRREEKIVPPDTLRMQRQRATMELFDALIYNTDRNLGNQLITTRDWNLHLIDHSRSFRTATDLPERFEERPAYVSRALYEKLRALELEPLVRLFDGVLTKSRVKALLARNKRILEKIEEDRKRLGEEIVFFD